MTLRRFIYFMLLLLVLFLTSTIFSGGLNLSFKRFNQRTFFYDNHLVSYTFSPYQLKPSVIGAMLPTSRAYSLIASQLGNTLITWKQNNRSLPEWSAVMPLSQDRLLTVIYNGDLELLNKDSETIWKTTGNFISDPQVDSNENIFIVERKETSKIIYDNAVKLVDYLLVKIAPDGKRLMSVSLYDLLSTYLPPTQIMNFFSTTYLAPIEEAVDQTRLQNSELFSIKSIRQATKSYNGFAQKDDLLLVVSNLNLLVVLDPSTGQPRSIKDFTPDKFSYISSAEFYDDEKILLMGKIDKGSYKLYTYNFINSEIEAIDLAKSRDVIKSDTPTGQITAVGDGSFWISATGAMKGIQLNNKLEVIAGVTIDVPVIPLLGDQLIHFYSNPISY